MQTLYNKKTEKTGGRESSLKTVVGRARAMYWLLPWSRSRRRMSSNTEQTSQHKSTIWSDLAALLLSATCCDVDLPSPAPPHGPRAPRETENKNRGSDETPSCCSQPIQPHLRPCIALHVRRPLACGNILRLGTLTKSRWVLRAGQSRTDGRGAPIIGVIKLGLSAPNTYHTTKEFLLSIRPTPPSHAFAFAVDARRRTDR
jgi:hypothetical protein